MIWINFLRDLKQTSSRLVSVILITLIAVLVYTGLIGVVHNIDRIGDDYFYGNNVASYWITGIALSSGDGRDLSRIPEITGVQPRIVLDAEEKGNSAITLLLFGVPDFSINSPYISQGRLPENSRELLISDEFAAARGLSVGQVYEMTVTGSDLSLRLTICGLIKNPERASHVSATNPAQNFNQYGYGYLWQDALTPLMGEGYYNQICVTTSSVADETAFRQQIYEVLGSKVVNILAFEDSPTAYSLFDTTYSLEVIIYVFPILFFLCAVLLMVSTMTRLVESSRPAIGTFKALGYSDGRIMLYYLLHALPVVVIGFFGGAFLGKYTSIPLVKTFATNCDLPPYTVVHDFSAWGQALVITAVCCFGSTWLVARSLLKESPAACMRPRPPASVGRLVLERFPAVWRRVSFNQKYIIRNTLRNKARMFTCIVGIAFCMGLVFVAFALKDSISHFAGCLAENQNRYDILVSLNSGVRREQYQRLEKLPSATSAEYAMSTACWMYSDDHLITSTLVVTEDIVRLRLYDPYAQGDLIPPSSGMILEENLANKLNVQAGDVLHIRFAGNAAFFQVPVAEVTRYVNGAYVSQSFWRSLGLGYTPTGVYLTTDNEAALVAELDRYDFVGGWQTRRTITDAAVDTLSSASMIVYILIVFGGALASVVIYNLGVMSFFEQLRGLATLTVLGFYEQEIKLLQLSENIIFAGIGIIAGIPIGMAINYGIIISINSFPLEVATKPFSFVVSSVITMLFALMVNVLIGRRVREIDMLGALKSIE